MFYFLISDKLTTLKFMGLTCKNGHSTETIPFFFDNQDNFTPSNKQYQILKKTNYSNNKNEKNEKINLNAVDYSNNHWCKRTNKKSDG